MTIDFDWSEPEERLADCRSRHQSLRQSAESSRQEIAHLLGLQRENASEIGIAAEDAALRQRLRAGIVRLSRESRTGLRRRRLLRLRLLRSRVRLFRVRLLFTADRGMRWCGAGALALTRRLRRGVARLRIWMAQRGGPEDEP